MFLNKRYNKGAIMHAIDLLLENGRSYVVTHQMVLYSLFRKPEFTWNLVQTEPAGIIWEPRGGLFNLAIEHSKGIIFIDIHSDDHLQKKHLEKQIEYIKDNKWSAVYLMAGASWYEYEDKYLRTISGGRASVIGFEELLSALRDLLNYNNLPEEIYELAQSYKALLEKQRNIFLHALERKEHDRIFYYSLFHRIRQKLPEPASRISSVNTSSGELYLLSLSDRLKFSYSNYPCELYYEVANDKLHFRLFTGIKNEELRSHLKESFTQGAHKVLDHYFVVIDDLRQTGEHISLCHIGYDFSIVHSLDTSIEILRKAYNSLPLILEAAKSELEIHAI